MSELILDSQWHHFGGWLRKYSHKSEVLGSVQMSFYIFLPPQAENVPVPSIYYLGGLTCTGENGAMKGFFAKTASERSVAIIYPDTSPRGAMIEGEDLSYDFGTGAGFYLDATQEPWSKNYRMYSYITQELPKLITDNFKIIKGKSGLFGHSMGGHGALTIAFKNPEKYCSVSAFAPICNPLKAPWGIKAFSGYLGNVESEWEEYDASHLMVARGPFPGLGTILIDQGKGDNFLKEQLYPESLQEACSKVGQKLSMRFHDNYDHSYYFISSFAEEHVNFHADALDKEYRA